MTQAAPAGWYPDPEHPTQQRYWDGVAWTQNVAPAAAGAPTSESGALSDRPAVDAPVLQTWKTSVGFSVLGLLVGFPLLVSLGTLLAIPLMMLTGLSSTQRGTGGPELSGLVGNVLMLVYALAVYPSYFSANPRLRSSKAISFANLMFGGLIFGLIWNGNLTKKTKGISYIVSAVLSGLTCLSLAVSIAGALLFGAASGSASGPASTSSMPVAPTLQKSVQPLARTGEANVYTDTEAGASFVIPGTWTELPLSKERKLIDTKFQAPDAATVMYGSVDLWSLLTEEDKRGKTKEDFDSMDDLKGDFSEILGYSGSDGTAQSVVLNGVEYFVLTIPVTANGSEMRSVQVVRVEKGRWYQFQYFSPPPGDAPDQGLETFYSVIASMSYP